MADEAERKGTVVSPEAEARLKALRAQIDALDDELVTLLNRRAACAVEIGHLKQGLGLEVYQPERELAVLEHVRTANKGPLAPDAVTRLFERIIDEARRLERLAKTSEDT
jgi:chorismate mutase-like protein